MPPLPSKSVITESEGMLGRMKYGDTSNGYGDEVFWNVG